MGASQSNDKSLSNGLNMATPNISSQNINTPPTNILGNQPQVSNGISSIANMSVKIPTPATPNNIFGNQPQVSNGIPSAGNMLVKIPTPATPNTIPNNIASMSLKIPTPILPNNIASISSQNINTPPPTNIFGNQTQVSSGISSLANMSVKIPTPTPPNTIPNNIANMSVKTPTPELANNITGMPVKIPTPELPINKVISNNESSQNNINGYSYKGCYKDDNNRAIKNNIGNGNMEQCIQMAEQKKYDTVGLQYGNQCWAGNQGQNGTNYALYGEQTNKANCNLNSPGAWTNMVYSKASSNSSLTEQELIRAKIESNAIKPTEAKPTLEALSALKNEFSLPKGERLNEGKVLNISSINQVNDLLVGGTFKLRVNLPLVPPYIKGNDFDATIGKNPNYFYLAVEQLDANCNYKSTVGSCINQYVDNKNCISKSLSSYIQNNSYRLVLITSDYALNSAISFGKNTDFTLVQINGNYYLKNVQTGYLPQLYQDSNNIVVYGDMLVNSKSNISTVDGIMKNTLCNQESVAPLSEQSFLRCNVPKDTNTYLLTTKNISDSSPVKIGLNSDGTINLSLLQFNSYGFPNNINTLTYCNFNVKTYAYIEKITNSIGTFLVNLVCFNSNSINKVDNQLNFTAELIKFPSNFIKNNSIYNIN